MFIWLETHFWKELFDHTFMVFVTQYGPGVPLVHWWLQEAEEPGHGVMVSCWRHQSISVNPEFWFSNFEVTLTWLIT